MIFIGKYEEMCPGRGFPSIKDSFEKKPYVGKNRIIAYLKNGIEDMVSFRIPRDVITGKPMPYGSVGMNDGEYTWWNDLAYYVERYNLRLPREFENKILKS